MFQQLGGQLDLNELMLRQAYWNQANTLGSLQGIQQAHPCPVATPYPQSPRDAHLLVLLCEE